MGRVYRAVQPGVERVVALKVIRPELASDRGFRERFEVESRLAASIDHPARDPGLRGRRGRRRPLRRDALGRGPRPPAAARRRGAARPGARRRSARPARRRTRRRARGRADPPRHQAGQRPARRRGRLPLRLRPGADQLRRRPDHPDRRPGRHRRLPRAGARRRRRGDRRQRRLRARLRPLPDAHRLGPLPRRRPGRQAERPRPGRPAGAERAAAGAAAGIRRGAGPGARQGPRPAPGDRGGARRRCQAGAADGAPTAVAAGRATARRGAGGGRGLAIVALAVAAILVLGGGSHHDPAPARGSAAAFPSAASLAPCGDLLSAPPGDCRGSSGNVDVLATEGKTARMRTMDFEVTEVLESRAIVEPDSKDTVTAPPGQRFVVIESVVANRLPAAQVFEPDQFSGRQTALYLYDVGGDRLPPAGPDLADYSAQNLPGGGDGAAGAGRHATAGAPHRRPPAQRPARLLLSRRRAAPGPHDAAARPRVRRAPKPELGRGHPARRRQGPRSASPTKATGV